MKYQDDNKRTTLTLDQKTIDDLKLIEKFHGGILNAVDRATESFRPDLSTSMGFRDRSVPQLDRSTPILDYARELQEIDKSGTDGGLNRNVRKSIVIDRVTLASVNKVAKTSQIGRDFIFIAAIRQERELTRNLIKLQIELHREFVEKKLKPMRDQLEDDLDQCRTKTEQFMESTGIFDMHFLYAWDPYSGLSVPPASLWESFAEVIEQTEKDVEHWEELL